MCGQGFRLAAGPWANGVPLHDEESAFSASPPRSEAEIERLMTGAAILGPVAVLIGPERQGHPHGRQSRLRNGRPEELPDCNIVRGLWATRPLLLWYCYHLGSFFFSPRRPFCFF